MSEMHERLRQARIEAGFKTLRAACRRFGWNESAYGTHETGHRGITRDAALEYAKAYRVPLDWLISGVGDSDGSQVRALKADFLALSPEERDAVCRFVADLRAAKRPVQK